MDYDDNLEHEALVPPAGAPSVKPVVPQVAIVYDPKVAVTVAQEVYGLTNSRCSQEFFDWCTDYLRGDSTGGAPGPLREGLERERNYWLPKAYLNRRLGKEAIAKKCFKRSYAVRCALMALRAVYSDRGGEQWIERCLFCALKAEGDDRCWQPKKGSGSFKQLTKPKPKKGE